MSAYESGGIEPAIATIPTQLSRHRLKGKVPGKTEILPLEAG